MRAVDSLGGTVSGMHDTQLGSRVRQYDAGIVFRTQRPLREKL